MNVVVLAGTLSSDPVHRVLKSGEEMLSCDVAVRTPERRAETVPVVWMAPPPAASGALVSGSEVVVTGRVRRRFFRAGGATASRTEVVADVVVPARRRVRAAKAVDAAVAALAS